MALRISESNPAIIMQNSKYNAVPVNNENNSIFNKLRKDIDRLDNKINQHSHTEQALLYALSPLPTARRIGSLPDTLDEKNYSRAGLLLGMAAANFPGDLREMGLAFKEGKNIFAKGLSAIEYKGQHPSTFFKNTFLHSLTEKYSGLKNVDKTLYSTNFGKFLKKSIGIKIDPKSLTSTNGNLMMNGNFIARAKFTGSYFQKLAGRALYRIPVLGLIASALLEAPAIVKSITQTEGNILDKGKALGKQLIKSAGYVGFINAGIAIAGAVLVPYGYIAALIGMGIGSSIGLMAFKALNKQVDRVIS